MPLKMIGFVKIASDFNVIENANIDVIQTAEWWLYSSGKQCV